MPATDYFDGRIFTTQKLGAEGWLDMFRSKHVRAYLFNVDPCVYVEYCNT